ncbi:hypothetical protein ACFLTH_13805 [Bacteroidota bacterium]
MQNVNKKNIERKNFFKTIGLSAMGLSLFSMLPFRSFGKVRPGVKKLSVKIHPSAVKRNS